MSASVAERSSIRPSIPVILLILLCLPVALYGLTFLWTNANPEFKARLMTLPLPAAAHFLGAGLALLIGGFQFSARLRNTRPRLHRWTGRVYLCAVLFGGLGGLAIARISQGGFSAHLGFSLLALLWLASASIAFANIRRGDIRAHRRWMIRNFALTFAAVTLRVELPLMTGGLGIPFADAYQAVAWLAWVPNLVVAEWWLLREGRR